MPAPHDPKLPLRLAYSHREKAEVAIRQCDRSLADGSLDHTSHAKVRAGYERELGIAQRTVQRLIGVERARKESLETKRRAALEEQLHLPERVTAGKLAARQANDDNRQLTQRLAELSLQIDACSSRLESRTSEELGGFIDLAFSEYLTAETRSLDAARQTAAPSASRIGDWYLSSGFAIVAAVAVFLPWWSKSGISSSLATTGSGLVQLAAHAGMPAGLARFAWIFFAVVPLLGILLTGGRNVRLIGWGFLVLGLLMLACGAFPGLALGASGTGPANVIELLASFRLGAILYCASAVGFIVLGAHRVSPPDDSLRHATTVSLAFLGSIGAVGLLAALALFGAQGVANVAFVAKLDDASSDRINFSVRNDGRDPITCYFPLPTDRAAVNSSVRKSHAFGVRLDILERGRDAYRSAPPAPYVWDLAQGPLPEDQAVAVNAGFALKGSLDLRQLSALGVDPSSVRLQLLTLDGSLVEEIEVTLDGRYLSIPAAIRDPLIIPPPPPRPLVTSTAPSVEPTPGAVATPADDDALRVEFTGAIGGRAIIRVYARDGSAYEEIIAGPGEPLARGWSVESLARQPSSVIMKHATSGADVRVIRGNIVEIKPVANN